MELKNVFIDAGKSLGNITFAGAGKENSSVQMAGVRLHQELTAFIPMYSARITLRLPFLERQG